MMHSTSGFVLLYLLPVPVRLQHSVFPHFECGMSWVFFKMHLFLGSAEEAISQVPGERGDIVNARFLKQAKRRLPKAHHWLWDKCQHFRISTFIKNNNNNTYDGGSIAQAAGETIRARSSLKHELKAVTPGGTYLGGIKAKAQRH